MLATAWLGRGQRTLSLVQAAATGVSLWFLKVRPQTGRVYHKLHLFGRHKPESLGQQCTLEAEIKASQVDMCRLHSIFGFCFSWGETGRRRKSKRRPHLSHI